MTWKGTKKGVTPEGEPFYLHEHPHSHAGGTDRPDIEHEHFHRHHSKRPHRHVWPTKAQVLP